MYPYGLYQRWRNTGPLFGLDYSTLPLYFTISDIVNTMRLCVGMWLVVQWINLAFFQNGISFFVKFFSAFFMPGSTATIQCVLSQIACQTILVPSANKNILLLVSANQRSKLARFFARSLGNPAIWLVHSGKVLFNCILTAVLQRRQKLSSAP